MFLQGLIPLLSSAPGVAGLGGGLARPEGGGLVVLEEAKPALLAALGARRGTSLLVVTARAGRAASLADQLQTWLGEDAAVRYVPEPDVLPYERLNPDARLTQARLAVLDELARGAGDGAVVVTSLGALLPRTIAVEGLRAAAVSIRQDGRVDPMALTERLLKLGYEQVNTVVSPGQFARRGGIIDCFPPQLEEPFRLDLFGDQVDTIRAFDPGSQRSVRLLSEVRVTPAREVLPPPWGAEPPALALDGCTEEAGAAFVRDVEHLARGGEVAAPWSYAPLFNRGFLGDYLPQGALVVLEEPAELARAFEEWDAEAREVRQGLLEARELPGGYPPAYWSWEQARERLAAGRTVLSLRRWAGEGEEALPFAPAPGYAGRLRVLLSDIERQARAGSRVVLASHQSQRLAELLRDQDMAVSAVEGLAEAPPAGSVSLVHGSLPGGWLLPLGREGERALVLITDAELFGFVKEERRRLPRRTQRRENPLEGLAPGDYVVHVEHGIGRYAGNVFLDTETPGQRAAGAGAPLQTPGPESRREYLFLEYAGGGKLYVPADQADRVTRYVAPGGYAPGLSHLGTQEWERAKERVRKAAQNVARELLQTNAAREVLPGRAYSSDTVWQQEMEASFPYVETPDQLQAVQDVKRDLEQPKPMERLVCGDVGYGKTEVAVRATFKAVQDGMQVAVLAPTTVLAQQHLQTFSQRLSAFPVKIEVLSRFRPEREQQEVLQGLRKGTVDVVIGTHRLVQKDVEFKDLGLVIVDEEQRFGVLHKEHFKRMRPDVDVLTLSATPIPRTLYMALVGVRDMSAMETPPEERVPIKTYVMEHDEGIIRQAVLRELERGGQVFFVHNRVQTIASVARQLQELVPEASIGIGHGQMPEEYLERTMLDFSAGRYDVLVCTTIIESGLDLPNVNTIIINNADKLGLAQLYQLRGRVGRCARRAYAYLLYTRNKALSETAQKRLQAVFEATELGAGYYIAMKDLEIRGAGNLLGVEQSGHIGAVGFDLYCRILAGAVEEAKAELRGEPRPVRAPQPPAVTVDLQIPSYLPPEYVPDLDVRLDIYRRMAAATSLEEVEEMAQELHDRFGPAPTPAANLLFGVRVKLLSARAGLSSVAREDGQVVLRMLDGLRVNGEPLRALQGVRPGNNQVRVEAGGRPSRWQPVLEETLRRMVQ